MVDSSNLRCEFRNIFFNITHGLDLNIGSKNRHEFEKTKI